MNKVLWSMCSCCGGLVRTYNRHFFGLFPVFETELFPLELKKVGKLMGKTCFFLGEKITIKWIQFYVLLQDQICPIGRNCT